MHLEKRKRERIRRRRIRTLLIVLGSVLVCLVLFIGIFYVPDNNVEVTGNSRYSDKEIREMVFSGFQDRNSLYLCYVRKTVVPDNAPFVSSIDAVYTGHKRVRLVVNENAPIGYIQQDGTDYYFDSSGIVLEAQKDANPTPDEEESVSTDSTSTSSDSSVSADSSVSSSSVSSSSAGTADYASLGLTTTLVDLNDDGVPETDADGNWLIDTDGDGVVDQTTAGVGLIDINGDNIPDITQTDYDNAKAAKEQEEKQQAEAAAAAAQQTASSSAASEGVTASSLNSSSQTGSGAEYHAALTDVTRITGLTDEKLTVGQKVPVSDDSVFSTIQALSRLTSKFDIKPDKIAVDKDLNFTLYYNGGDVRVLLGKDSLLEDKMTKAAAILPQLSGMKGDLHLESYTEDTVNIVFDKSS
ncbi:MAG: cell division protein FtsQ/DivIB [Bilifractor sp.]